MEESFIPISIILVIIINLGIYFFIKNREEEKELRDYFKKDTKRHKKQKNHQLNH